MASISAAILPGSPLLNPAALRIPTAARNTEQRKRHTSDVKIAKPRPDEWVRIHTDQTFRWENIWAYEEDKNFYLLPPALYDGLEESVQRVFADLRSQIIYNLACDALRVRSDFLKCKPRDFDSCGSHLIRYNFPINVHRGFNVCMTHHLELAHA